MKPSLALLLLSGLPILIASIAGAADVVSEEDQYRNVVKGRAEKIVSALSIPDDAARMRVQTAISNQYVNLHAVHAKRDATIKAAANVGDTANAEEPGRRAKENASTETARLHDAFLKQLAADLSPGQVDHVKDGMTYGVVPLTYSVYLKM